MIRKYGKLWGNDPDWNSWTWLDDESIPEIDHLMEYEDKMFYQKTGMRHTKIGKARNGSGYIVAVEKTGSLHFRNAEELELFFYLAFGEEE